MFKSRKQPSISEAAAPSLRPISVDLNFLPDRYRGRGLRILITLRPWLFLLGFALLLIPTAQLSWRDAVELATVEVDLAEVSEALEGYQPLADERALLEARITSADAQITEIQAAYETINIQHVTWSDVVPLILAQVPAGLDLTLLSQSDTEVVLEGLAEAYPLPSILADNLEALGEFETVTIRSVVRLTHEEQTEIEPDESPAADSSTDNPEAEEPASEGSAELLGEQPTDGAEDQPTGDAEDQPSSISEFGPSSAAEELRPFLYRFEIHIIFPSIVGPTPELIDES